MLGVGAKSKTYVEDLFNTDVWTGDGATHQVVNNIKLSSDGGMVWMKSRSHANNHMVADTVRGSNKVIFPDANSVEQTSTGYFTSFNSNGFTTGDSSYVYESGKKMAGWSFKKTKGFFDVVTYTGNGTNRTIAHSLGCKPGMILIKELGGTSAWLVQHRAKGASQKSELNTTNAFEASSTSWNDADPTSTHFSLGTSTHTNGDGDNFVAYLFAGGESDAATAKSVLFDGSNDYITIPTHADLAMGTGDLTWECWITTDTTGVAKYIYDARDGTSANRAGIWLDDTNKIRIYADNTSRDSRTILGKGQWYHIAWTRQGTTSRLFINGLEELSWSDSVDYAAPASNAYIGGYPSQFNFGGKISNVRIVKGTAVYTSSFRPPTAPLTNITNTKLLCCNASTATGSTVSPTTITDSGTVAKGDSPFDDPEGFKFGENGDQNVIKCGSFTGAGSTYREAHLGFEPQRILLKNADAAKDWKLFDCIRGLSTDAGDDEILNANSNNTEAGANVFEPTPTGFKPVNSSQQFNGDGHTMLYVAIRRPDGYVSKPADAGTNTFAMDAGNSSTAQGFTSGFPVDFALTKKTSATSNWEVTTRLTDDRYLLANAQNAQNDFNKLTFDDNTGWNTHDAYDSVWQSFMWKRSKGFDVVTYTGDGVPSRRVPHNLNSIPEMIWLKKRDGSGNTADWMVASKHLNSGNSPWERYLVLNKNQAEASDIAPFANISPTSTDFCISANVRVNDNYAKYIAFLFSSVKGISHCGTFTGNGSTQTITIPNGGFQPRFLIMKCVSDAVDWQVLDTTRGWGSGDDKYMELNTTAAQYTTTDFGAPTSTGFTLAENAGFNGSGRRYIYYAHA